ncbi:hypothetical protein BYZ73_19735 [Rhodovulum viride]|uniref:ATP dependent DNA ligase-like protein n=1 Tax=Rhodovulum viride TaxID=1231134 RepID=A0ABX9DB84_9RHOB|nr:hypothetical protein BYZ73_19735 [Rhodovulum viride]
MRPLAARRPSCWPGHAKKSGRTVHLPFSPGATSDDKIMSSLEGLMAEDLVVTEKMDGENTTLHAGGSHARRPHRPCSIRICRPFA